ncbi:MAG: hypothetical protein K8S98_15725 [Planctomycetes bacterium]|nr:hypothetical protein [Planctomycetota bacterium]
MFAFQRSFRIAALLAVVGVLTSSAYAGQKDIRFGDQPGKGPGQADVALDFEIPHYKVEVVVPEIAPAALGSLVALLVGGGLLLRSRRSAKSA